MTKIDQRGRKVNVEDGKQGFQETKRTETTLDVSLNDHYGVRIPAQPTRLGKAALRKHLPTRKDDSPITVLEFEGQQFWSNRNVILDVETIAPYMGDFKAPAGESVAARVTGGTLVSTEVEPRAFAPHDGVASLIERTERRISQSYPDQFDVTNAALVERKYAVDRGMADQYEITVDNGGLATKTPPRKIRINADTLHLALGTDDLSTVGEGVTLEQASLGNGVTGGPSDRFGPLVITRNGRRVGYVMVYNVPTEQS